MPGSLTTPGLGGTRAVVPPRIAFHSCNSVGTRDNVSFAAPWLAYAIPYRRFAIPGARLGADVVRYSFTVVDSHHLLLADLTGALQLSRSPAQHSPLRRTAGPYSTSRRPADGRFRVTATVEGPQPFGACSVDSDYTKDIHGSPSTAASGWPLRSDVEGIASAFSGVT
jgi:hypothetical protein